MHRVCLTAGRKTCEVGPDLMHRLIEAEVDLVLHGHDHNPYFAETLGAGDSQGGYGYSLFQVTESSIEMEFVGTTTSYTDTFSIRDPR